MDRGSLGAELSGIKAWAVLLSVAVFGSFVVACGGGAADSNSASKAATSSAAPSASEVVPEIEVPALWALGDARDVQTLTDTAVYEQIGGLETTPDGTRVRIMLERDEPVQVGQTYLFFASLQDDGSVVAPPFGRMNVRPDGSLAAAAGWEHLGAMTALSRKNLEDAEREISATSRD